MTQHDKHQYYFEKYLRNEMSLEEREVFDRKLADDAALRMAFEYYKLNRQKLLEQLIEEHQLAKRDNRLNKLIFLLISLTGLILVISPFVNKSDVDDKTKEVPQNIFVRYIPFLNWENRTDKKVEEPSLPKHPAATVKVIEKEEPIEALEPSLDRNERLLSDEFVGDTFIPIWDKGFYAKYVMYKDQKDTLAMDSLMKRLNGLSNKDKQKKLLVEYWDSPLDYKGYLYLENKLVLYGMPYPNSVYIYKVRDTSVVVLPNGQFPLIEQPKFMSF
jgi:hypothetical protein